MKYLEYIIWALIIIPPAYVITIIIFDLLLRGFAPFIPSRPWVISQILGNITIKQPNPRIIAFSTGRSGVVHAFEKKYPGASLLGVEGHWFPYIVSKIQSVVRSTKIKVIHSKTHHVNVSDADLIYCHLHPDELRDLSQKFKFECRSGTQIISTGFNIPYLAPKYAIDLPDRKGRMDWLSKNQKLFQSKQKKYQKENKAYVYEI